MTSKSATTIDVRMKAEEAAQSALGVIGQYVNIDLDPTDPTWATVSSARINMPAVLVDLVAHVEQQAGASSGGRFDRLWDHTQGYFRNVIFDDLIAGGDAKGVVVLDLDPVDPGRPHMGSFDGDGADDQLPTIWFTGIPETSPMYDDTAATCWALYSIPGVQSFVSSNDGRTVYLPSKQDANVYGIIRTFPTRTDAKDAIIELRQALVTFAQASPAYLDKLEALQNADPVHDIVDPITGEVLRQTRRVQEAAEQPF